MFLEIMQAVTGIFVVVYDGQHALKFTLGRARDVVGPGVHFKWPIIQKFRVKETKHTTLDLEPQVIQLQDDLVYEVDAKVIYQITDLYKALIEVDDVVLGLQNLVVMAVQQVIQAQDRESIRDTARIAEQIRGALASAEQQWGVTILKIGFSNISPSPASLEITQLELLARERLTWYRQMLEQGIAEESAVALVTGAVVTAYGEERADGRRAQAQQTARLAAEVEALARRKEHEAIEQGTREALGQTDEGGEPPPSQE